MLTGAAIDAAGDLAARFVGWSSLAVTDPTIAREFRVEVLDRVEGNAQIQHATILAKQHFESNQDDDFVGRHDLDQLWVALHALDARFQFDDVLPGSS